MQPFLFNGQYSISIHIYNAQYVASQFLIMFCRGAATAAQRFYIQALIWIWPQIWGLPCMKEVPCTPINTSTTQYEAVHLLLMQIIHNKTNVLNKGIFDCINRHAGVLFIFILRQQPVSPESSGSKVKTGRSRSTGWWPLLSLDTLLL